MDILKDKVKPLYFKYLAAASGSALTGSIFAMVDAIMVGKYHLQLKWHYNPMTAYNHSKLAVLTFALELSRRLKDSGSSIKVLPVHPGVAATDITRGGDRANPFVRKLAKKMFGLIGQSAEQGAWSIIYATTSDDVQSGFYYGPGGAGERKGVPAQAKIAPHALERYNGKKLWILTEEMTGITFQNCSSTMAVMIG